MPAGIEEMPIRLTDRQDGLNPQFIPPCRSRIERGLKRSTGSAPSQSPRTRSEILPRDRARKAPFRLRRLHRARFELGGETSIPRRWSARHARAPRLAHFPPRHLQATLHRDRGFGAFTLERLDATAAFSEYNRADGQFVRVLTPGPSGSKLPPPRFNPGRGMLVRTTFPLRSSARIRLEPL